MESGKIANPTDSPFFDQETQCWSVIATRDDPRANALSSSKDSISHVCYSKVANNGVW